ncbi:MAG: (Fe-S)-binding protein, partial [archaeon]|nr:(Fe-S)-binding protein [archaeon]
IFSEIMHGIREYSFSKGLMDDELNFTKNHDDLMVLGPIIQSDVEHLTNKIDFIREDSSLKITDKGEIAFFIGCNSLMEEVFSSFEIKYKDSPRTVISILNEGGIIPVVLDTKCCGHDSYWMGDIETAKKLAVYNIKKYKEAGVKTIIVECAEGYRMWKFDYPKLVDDFNFEIKHFSEYVIENNLLNLFTSIQGKPIKVTYHDPCRLGRLGGIYDEPREILKKIPGIELIEMEFNKKDANCCGISIFKCCNSDTKRLRENRIKEALDTGAEYLITTCPKCVTHLNCYIKGINETGNISENSKQLKIMDLASFIGKISNRT